MSSLIEAQVPDIGNYHDVPVIELLVKPGDTVTRDQGLVTLESDKATMEVPAPAAGVVKELKVKLGDAVSEGALIALIEAAASAVAVAAPPKPATAAPLPSAAASAPAPAPTPATAAPPPRPIATVAAPSPVRFDSSAVMPDQVPYASPALRLFARELGVDLKKVKGSGKSGRILREDVQAFVKQALGSGGTRGAAVGNGLNLLPWPEIDFAKFGPIEAQPLGKIKRATGANLARNWALIPHVTQHDLADITAMEAFRKQLGAEQKDLKITPLVFLIKAAVAALQAFPTFNASLNASGDTLTLKKYFHIGIAVDTPDGLVVPVLRDCDRKGVFELVRELGTISAKARDKKLTPADMSGGCFSISSLGGIGGTAFTPIINAPEVAILGVSKSSLQPVWNGTAFEPRLMLPLSLSYDHRVIDGAAAARFTAFMARALGDLRRLLL
ncbi:MAG: dihydrolipoyllysine-residue acetyltransferase [Metallibacterium scheffleri]|jgi:pyruvate dehydrogenase E2 component (dihydrolipoamide acetyltransferase)|nr:dihydrolipoyllysine-residue acetyltransferase [Metallibacterium scheffleri]